MGEVDCPYDDEDGIDCDECGICDDMNEDLDDSGD